MKPQNNLSSANRSLLCDDAVQIRDLASVRQQKKTNFEKIRLGGKRKKGQKSFENDSEGTNGFQCIQILN
jgi:hypothetical protein